MTRYFFHMRDGRNVMEDPDGAEHANLDAAHTEAIAAAREILSEAILSGKLPWELRFEITDEEGQVVLVVPFKSAISSP